MDWEPVSCDRSTDDFLCPEWCKRMERYRQKYFEYRALETRDWHDYTRVVVNSLLPIMIFCLAWTYFTNSWKKTAANRKLRVHERKIDVLHKQNRLKMNQLVKRPPSDDVHLDSIVDRPIPEEAMQLMWRRRKAERAYLRFRRRRTNQEIRDAHPKLARKREKIVMPEKYLEIDMLPCHDELNDNKRKEKRRKRIRPMFTNDRVEVDWKIAVMDEKGAPIHSSMLQTQASEMDKTKKG